MICFEAVKVNGLNETASAGKDISVSWRYAETWKRNLSQTSFEVKIFTSPEAEAPVFSSGTIKGEATRYDVVGFCPEERRDYFFTVTAELSDKETVRSGICSFHTGLFGRSSFESLGCHWVTHRASAEKAPAAPEFVRTFRLPARKTVCSAKAYLFAAGFTCFSVNGEAPDDRMLAPANSKYENRCFYETYDIASLLSPGENRLSLVCGAGYDETYSKFGCRYFGKKGFIGLIQIDFEDGESLLIPSDTRWQCYETRITACSMYHGERYDNRKENFARIPVTAADRKAPYAPDGLLLPRPIPQIRVTEEQSPVSVRETEKGLLCDFGENKAGVLKLTLSAPEGTAVTLFHTEMLLPDGLPDPYTNRSAAATDTFICSGEGKETFMPLFTYHCFRYALISGVKEEQILEIRREALSSDLERTGYFTCSDPMLNRIHGLMCVGMRNNLFSIPTDCAVRDERTPCDMDSQAIERAVMTEFDAEAYYTAWLDNVLDRFTPGSGNPDWKGDIISLMWRLYDFYDDLRPAAAHYDTALAFFFDTVSRTEEGVYTKGYGDWCHPNNNTWDGFFGSVPAVNTALLFGMGQKLIALGKALGKEEKTLAGIEAACQSISDSFIKKYVKKNGTVCEGEQTDYALPLYEKMLTGEIGAKAAGRLIKKIKADGCHKAGIYGEMAMYRILRELGEDDLYLRLLRYDDYPGYGNLIAKGATSLWEQWRYKGRMDSHSHGMFAGADVAFYENFAGIVATSAGGRTVRISPMIRDSLTMTEAKVRTVTGNLSVKTERLCRGYEIKITVPVGCTATVVLPQIGGEEYAFFDGERQIGYEAEKVIGSGCYHFRCVPVALLEDH